ELHLIAFGAVTDELILAHHLADGADEVYALIEGDVVSFVVLAVLAADGEACAVHRARVAHILDADARDAALLARKALEIDLHFAVGEILRVVIKAVEGVAFFDDERAVLYMSAAAVWIDLPIAHAVLEVVEIDDVARLDVLDLDGGDGARRAVTADE